MDKLTGYGVNNDCKVCKEKFTCYADLRDHVQTHGDAYRDPYGNPEAYKEYARKRKKIQGSMVSLTVAEAMEREKLKKQQVQAQQQAVVTFHNNVVTGPMTSTEDAAAILLNIKHESILFNPQQLQLQGQQLDHQQQQPPLNVQYASPKPEQMDGQIVANAEVVHGALRQVQQISSAPLQEQPLHCLLYTSPSPRDRQKSRMPSSA